MEMGNIMWPWEVVCGNGKYYVAMGSSMWTWEIACGNGK